MKKQIVSLTLSTLFGIGAAIAAPQVGQDQQNAPAAPQVQPQPAPQNEGSRHMDPNRQAQMLGKRLNLTADQQNQILPILSDRQAQVESILADNSLSKKDRHAKLRSVREDSSAKIRALLNDAQKQAYDQMEQRRQERTREHRDHPNAGSGNGAAN